MKTRRPASHALDYDGAMLRVLVGLNRLWLAGAEINAVDMARAMRQKGHEVVLFAQDEDDRAMVNLAEGYGFEVRLLPRGRRTRGLVTPLNLLVVNEHIDLVHAYYPRLANAAFLGTNHRNGTPVVMTYYGMDSPRGLPRYSHLIVGTETLAIGLRSWYRAPVSVIEPPVDTARDHPGAVDPSDFLRRYDLPTENLRVVVVSRLEKDMKMDGVKRLMVSMKHLRPDLNLVIVGSGDGLEKAQLMAKGLNEHLGRPAILLTGRMADPRPAYAAADLVVGMGGSALRGMAFGKPVIVVGEAGFALPFEAETEGFFFRHGFYGEGPLHDLTLVLKRFLDNNRLRSTAGAHGMQIVRSRYSLDVAGGRLERIYRTALSDRLTPAQWWGSAAYTSAYFKIRQLRALEDARLLYLAELDRIRTRGLEWERVTPRSRLGSASDRRVRGLSW